MRLLTGGGTQGWSQILGGKNWAVFDRTIGRDDVAFGSVVIELCITCGTGMRADDVAELGTVVCSALSMFWTAACLRN